MKTLKITIDNKESKESLNEYELDGILGVKVEFVRFRVNIIKNNG